MHLSPSKEEVLEPITPHPPFFLLLPPFSSSSPQALLNPPPLFSHSSSLLFILFSFHPQLPHSSSPSSSSPLLQLFLPPFYSVFAAPQNSHFLACLLRPFSHSSFLFIFSFFFSLQTSRLFFLIFSRLFSQLFVLFSLTSILSRQNKKG